MPRGVTAATPDRASLPGGCAVTHRGCGVTLRLVEVRDLGRVFDVSKPWLNRVLEGGRASMLKAVDGVSLRHRARARPSRSSASPAPASRPWPRWWSGCCRRPRGEVRIDGVSMSSAAAIADRQRCAAASR